MHIGIVGTFDVENYGDLLFPIIADFELRKRLGDVTMHAFSYNAKTLPDWPYDVTSVADLPDMVERLDALLIGGGYLIRFDKTVAPGYGPPATYIHHPTGYWLTPALVAQASNVPVVWNAPGMHVNEVPRWAEPLVKLSLKLSPYIAVRDDLSKTTLAPLVDGDRIVVVPDTAFGLSRLLGERQDTSKPYIVIQPTRQTAHFSAFVKAHADRFAPYDLLALPIGPVLGDDAALIADVPGLVQLPSWPQPLQLAEVLSNASAVIGHSYHMAITALTTGVPVFMTANLDVGKFNMLRAHDTVHRYADISEADPDWFFSRLGKRAPNGVVGDTQAELDRHWDRIAGIVKAGPLRTQPSIGRFLQLLPALLEHGA